MELAAPYRVRVAFAVVLIVAGTAAGLMVPLAIGRLVDLAAHPQDKATVGYYALFLATSYLSKFGLGFLGAFLLARVGERMVNDLRLLLFSRIHALDLQFVGSQRTGDLASRLNADTAAVREVSTETVASLLNESFTLAGSVFVMAATNWHLACIVLAMAPCATMLSRHFGPRLEAAGRRAQDSNADAQAFAQESLSGFQVVKVLQREGRQQDAYRVHLAAFFSASMAAIGTTMAFRLLTSLLSASTVVAIFWCGGLQVLSGSMTAGALVTYLFYSQNVSQSFAAFSVLYGNTRKAVGASGRVLELIDMAPTITGGSVEPEATSAVPRLEFRDVVFSYDGRRPVLQGLNMSVHAGEIVALAGRSGLGKSTVLSLIVRLYAPQQGNVLVDGVEAGQVALGWLRREIAVVPQDAFLFSMSIRENIRFGRLDATDDEVEEAARLSSAHEFIHALPKGYDTVVGERGLTLSGGQRQRVTLARALVQRSSIVLLDEATSAADVTTEAEIHGAIRTINAKHGVTFVLVAHRESTLALASRRIFLEEDRRSADPGRATNVWHAPCLIMSGQEVPERRAI